MSLRGTRGEQTSMAQHGRQPKANWWMVAAAAVGGYLFGANDQPSSNSQVSSLMGSQEWSASSEVYYGNCTDARAAGAAPVRVGDPGYASHLDRDNDGIGCEY